MEKHDRSTACDHDDELPDDYEQCGTCGYDHGYEQAEAQAAHRAMENVDEG
jgi:hypothetical protein